MTSNKRSKKSLAGPVKAAMKELGRAGLQLEQAQSREQRAKDKLDAATKRAREHGDARARVAVRKARERVQQAAQQRREAASRYREARTLLREQQQLARDLERKENAKQRAIAEFVKKWEREYDQAVALKRQNVRLRKKVVRRG